MNCTENKDIQQELPESDKSQLLPISPHTPTLKPDELFQYPHQHTVSSIRRSFSDTIDNKTLDENTSKDYDNYSPTTLFNYCNYTPHEVFYGGDFMIADYFDEAEEVSDAMLFPDLPPL